MAPQRGVDLNGLDLGKTEPKSPRRRPMGPTIRQKDYGNDSGSESPGTPATPSVVMVDEDRNTYSNEELDSYINNLDEDGQAEALFHYVDEDGSGSISKAELRHLTKKLGMKMTRAEINEAMAEMDEDSSGEVNFDEFSLWWETIAEEGASSKWAMALTGGGMKNKFRRLAARKGERSCCWPCCWPCCCRPCCRRSRLTLLPQACWRSRASL